MSDTEQTIREHAYRLWEEQGRPEGREIEHWREAERIARGANEGEGSQTGAREYNQATREFINTGAVEEAAQEAAAALDDDAEAAELRKAEKAGKARSRGEDPVRKKR